MMFAVPFNILRYNRPSHPLLRSSHPLHTQFIVDVLLFNYLPPGEEYEHAVKLLADKHPAIMKGDNMHSKHIRDFYLNNNPLKLGGRCCPLSGQASSNNGGEKRGGLIKGQHRRIIKRVKKTDKSNPLYIMCACAQDLEQSKSISHFATSPIKESSDYNILRQINKFEPSKPGNMCLDLLYMICTNQDKSDLYDTSKVIGDSKKSFVAFFPSASSAYTHMKMVSKESAVMANAISFFEMSGTFMDPLDEMDTVEKCRNRIGNMTSNEVKALKLLLYDDLISNTISPKTNETFNEYMQRCCQRFPAGILTTTRSKQRRNELNKRVTRTRRKKKTEAEKKAEAEKNASKYNEQVKSGEAAESNAARKSDELAESVEAVAGSSGDNAIAQDENDGDIDIYCGEDFSLEELESFCCNHGLIDDDKIITRELVRECELRVKRQLGAWVAVTVDAVKRKVCCNCEDYCADRYCPHCALFEVLQFDMLPTNKCAKPGEKWVDIKTACIKTLKDTYVDIKRN